MTIAITMTVNNRPKYLRQVLDALMANLIPLGEDYVLLPSVEPPTAQSLEHISDEIRNILNNVEFSTCFPYYHTVQQGCNRNTHHAMKRGFDYADKIIHLEDDLLPAQDFLIYNTLMLKRFKDSNIVAIGSWNSEVSYCDEMISRRNMFCSWGVATWKNRWPTLEHMFKKTGCSNEGIAWDTVLDNEFRRNNYYSIIPSMCRVRNIGKEGGTWMSAAQWDKMGYHPWMGDDELCTHYELED